MGLTPDQCVAFEDSENGVRSVVDAGIRALAVTVNDYTLDHDFSGATLVLDHLGDPGLPCTVIAGELGGGMLDLAAVRALHRRVSGG